MNDVTKDQLKDIRSDLTHLINMLDRNTTSLWLDDLSCTTECVVLENVDLVDENYKDYYGEGKKLEKAYGGSIQEYLTWLTSKYDLRGVEQDNNPNLSDSYGLKDLGREHFRLPLKRL